MISSCRKPSRREGGGQSAGARAPGSHKHDIATILKESFHTEKEGLELYLELLGHVNGKHIALEEHPREMILAKGLHVSEAEKRMRR